MFEAIAGLHPTVTEVLLYHVVPNAKVTGKDVLSGPFSQRISMANGEKLRVTVLSRSARFPVILLGDKDGKFFNDSVVRSKINAVETDNTVVHGISGVLSRRFSPHPKRVVSPTAHHPLPHRCALW